MINYLNPDYTAVIARRLEMAKKIKDDPKLLAALKVHYATNPWDFVSDWGVTFEPRNVAKGRITNIPFVLWERQKEYLQWLYSMWRNSERGIVEKSRDCGVTWLSVGFAVSMWCFVDGFTTGFGSRKEELVDKNGDSKCIFEKIRFFIKNLPVEFIPEGFVPRLHSAHMRIVNPATDAAIIGESGDEIGRGGRTSIYLVDEAAFIEHQDTVDAALSQNTDCQVDISTPNGNGNAFFRKRMRLNNTNKLFVFDWKDDPRKGQDWYDKQVEDLSEVIVAQEIDRDYNASQEDSFIPAKFISAAIDAHVKLGFHPQGVRTTGFDPADVGDCKAVVNRHGSVVKDAMQKRSGDITDAINWAFMVGDDFRCDIFGYDADGMGAPTIRMALTQLAVDRVKVVAYNGSAGVMDPGKSIVKVKQEKKKFRDGVGNLLEGSNRTNADTYQNFRAQSWTWLRDRFERTYEAIQRQKQGLLVNFDADDLISIDSRCECRDELVAELSRPMRIYSPNGKILVESKASMKKRGVDSPNLADALVIAMSLSRPVPSKRPLPTYEPYTQAMPGVM